MRLRTRMTGHGETGRRRARRVRTPVGFVVVDGIGWGGGELTDSYRVTREFGKWERCKKSKSLIHAQIVVRNF